MLMKKARNKKQVFESDTDEEMDSIEKDKAPIISERKVAILTQNVVKEHGNINQEGEERGTEEVQGEGKADNEEELVSREDLVLTSNEDCMLVSPSPKKKKVLLRIQYLSLWKMFPARNSMVD